MTEPVGQSVSPRYRTIVADPPWPIKWQGSAGRKGETGGIRTRPLAYPTLTIAEIVALPVKALAHDQSNLFLWTTNQFLHEALGISRAWGFQFRMLWTWCKTNGMGGHPRNATEHIVVASRGTTATLGRHAPATLNWHVAPAMRHSEKPDYFMEKIEEFSPGPRAEPFARRARFGWDYPIGDQALGGVAA